MSLKRSNRPNRLKRDETENIGRAFGRGIGYFVGEPCTEHCNSLLFHVYCNLTTNQCECLPDYPVNIDNRLCVKATKLGGECEEDASCKHQDIHSSCTSGKCTCQSGYYLYQDQQKRSICVAGYDPNMMLILGIITAIFIFSGILLIVFKISRMLNTPSDTIEQCEASPPVLLAGLEHVLQKSKPQNPDPMVNKSHASCSMLTHVISPDSRHPSTSTISSLKSYLSLRSHSSSKNPHKYGTACKLSNTSNSPAIIQTENINLQLNEHCAAHCKSKLNSLTLPSNYMSHQ